MLYFSVSIRMSAFAFHLSAAVFEQGAFLSAQLTYLERKEQWQSFAVREFGERDI